MDFLSQFISRRKASQDETAVLINVASDCVTCSLVTFSSKELPKILYMYRHDLSLASSQAAESLLKDTLEGLKAGLLSLQKVYHQRIRKVHCFLSSPWQISQTKIVSVMKQNPALISERLIADLIGQEEKAIIAEVKKGTYIKDVSEDLVVIESKVLSLRLNGYETAMPHNKMARSIELSFYTSLCGREFLSNVRKVIADVLGKISLEFHTFPLAAFSAVKDHPQCPSNFLLIDISGEVTDIAIVKKGVILQTLTLPVGKHFFIRALSRRMKVPYQVAASMLQLHAQGKDDPSMAEELSVELKKESSEWCAFLEQALTTFSEASFTPRSVFLTTEDELAPFFLRVVGDFALTQYSAEKTLFAPVVIDDLCLKGIYQLDRSIRKGTPILLESVFINKIKSISLWQKML